jgi:ketosteroid isomerase-like protein
MTAMGDAAKLMREYLHLVNTDRFAECAGLMADGAKIWIVGMGDIDRDAFTAMAKTVQGLFNFGPRMEELNLIDAGDSAVVEVTTTGDGANGYRYENRYCILITAAHGKIVSLTEYLDPTKTTGLFAPPT